MSLVSRFALVALGLFRMVATASAADVLPPLPEPAASFGAAIEDGWLYVYGGNSGRAHEYNRECVKGDFFRLQLPAGTAWEKLPGGLSLMGASLVSDAGHVIRVGGLTARNEKGAKDDLLSTAEVLQFDPGLQQWKPLPKLPEPRSSGDAVVLDHILYAGGGWDLSKNADSKGREKWHDSLVSLDLRAPEKGWHSEPQPFRRRAIAMAAQGGRVWFIGGIDRDGDLLEAVDWFEPATGKWGKGPDLPEEPMAGFGAAACAQDGRLYVSPMSGKLLRLSADGAKWEQVATLNPARFFHRLLPLADGRLIAVGGSSEKGHVAEPEILSLGSATPPAAAATAKPAKPAAFDWPQWRGPHRDGVSTETGWRKDWPVEGPRKLWSASVGIGMSSPVVADGRLITQGDDGEGMDTIFAFDAETGRELWRCSFPCKTAAHEMPIVPNGPCATPTIVGGHVFALTREGELLCVETTNGRAAWHRNLVTDLGGKRPVYGYAQSPLAVDGRIYLDVGAEPNHVGSTVALDAANGEVKWRAGTGEAGYSSARIFERDGHRYIAMLKGEALDVFDPADGHVVWSYKITGADFTNSVTPVFDGHRILVSNTSEAFARMLDWDAGSEPNVRVAWKNQQFALLFNNPILLNGTLYAFNEKRRDPVQFTALDAQSGEIRWTSDTVPIGTFILSDGHWIFFTRQGEVILAPATAEVLKPVARFQAVEGKCYATPALANGRLYVRSNAGEVAAFDLR
jgi:outer membrane protein assembly factor BamB